MSQFNWKWGRLGYAPLQGGTPVLIENGTWRHFGFGLYWRDET
jgi:hypothetical protein